MAVNNRSFLVGLIVAGLATTGPTPSADACGVKLLLRTGAIKPQEGVRRSSNPSRVLLLGDPPRKLVRELKDAGHQVDVAQTTEAAKSKDYKVVVTSSARAEEARTKYPNAKIVASNDAKQVEASVARERVGLAAARAPVARREERTPVAAGPAPKADYRRLVASKPEDAATGTGTEPIAAKPADTRTAIGATKPVDPKPDVKPTPEPKTVAVAPKPEPKPEPKPVTKRPDPKPVDTQPADDPADKPDKPVAATKTGGRPPADIGFGFNGALLAGSKAELTSKWAEWLKQNSSASIVIEGHTDTVGEPTYNEWLSQKRAEVVRDSLLAAGVDSSRMEIVAHGENKPKYGDGTDFRNRRVSITVK